MAVSGVHLLHLVGLSFILVRISVLLNIKGDGAFEVDLSVRDRRDVAHVVFAAVPIKAFGDPSV